MSCNQVTCVCGTPWCTGCLLPFAFFLPLYEFGDLPSPVCRMLLCAAVASRCLSLSPRDAGAGAAATMHAYHSCHPAMCFPDRQGGVVGFHCCVSRSSVRHIGWLCICERVWTMHHSAQVHSAFTRAQLCTAGRPYGCFSSGPTSNHAIAIQGSRWRSRATIRTTRPCYVGGDRWQGAMGTVRWLPTLCRAWYPCRGCRCVAGWLLQRTLRQPWVLIGHAIAQTQSWMKIVFLLDTPPTTSNHRAR